jgi:hypothetical protein
MWECWGTELLCFCQSRSEARTRTDSFGEARCFVGLPQALLDENHPTSRLFSHVQAPARPVSLS